jgi:hypothetical protein
MTIELNQDALLKFMKKEGFDAEIQKETNQIYCPLKVANREFPLFLRIFENSELLQIIVFFPSTIKETAMNDLGRFLHHINKELDIPGFGMDESSKVAFYRIMLPAFGKKVEADVLKPYLKSLPLISENFGQAIIAVANGITSYAAILKQIQQASK